jgi:hypothetical protein
MKTFLLCWSPRLCYFIVWTRVFIPKSWGYGRGTKSRQIAVNTLSYHQIILSLVLELSDELFSSTGVMSQCYAYNEYIMRGLVCPYASYSKFLNEFQ